MLFPVFVSNGSTLKAAGITTAMNEINSCSYSE
jgi:hypothetical protein